MCKAVSRLLQSLVSSYPWEQNVDHRKWDVTSEKAALERFWGKYWINKEMGTVFVML